MDTVLEVPGASSPTSCLILMRPSSKAPLSLATALRSRLRIALRAASFVATASRDCEVVNVLLNI